MQSSNVIENKSSNYPMNTGKHIMAKETNLKTKWRVDIEIYQAKTGWIYLLLISE